ncbi:DUF5677 domain-containing protein [Photobacterium swingsii]|uniref:DUF6988 family protein n=1 Tax=Photobacterium swingsii TaxID=680026 RepID=UPI003553F70E
MKLKVNRWAQSLKTHSRSLSLEKADNRKKLSLALMYLSNEHFHSILHLCNRGIPASGFALLRPQYEAYIRGLWINYCATDEQVNRVYADKGFKKNNFDMLSALESLNKFSDGRLTHLNSVVWDKSHDFSHGGSIQAKWHIDGESIGSMYTNKEVNGLLTVSSSMSLSNSLSIAELCENAKVSQKLVVSHKRIF